MSTLTNPHDKFFKTVFSQKDVAQDFLRQYLPADVVALLKPETLEYIKESFIDPHLQEFYSDLLFKVALITGEQGWIYILIEHKSYQEPVIAFHLLRYMVQIWDMVLKQRTPRDPIRLPVILPVILYHGTTPWKAGQHLHDLVACPETLQACLPDFQYFLWDASTYPDDAITGIAVLQAALLLFKHIFHPDLLRERLPHIFEILEDVLTARTGRELFMTMIIYILNASSADTLTYDDVKRAVDDAFPRIGGTIMPTIADVLRQEGREQGLEQGLEQGRAQGILQNGREAVLEILEIRFARVSASLTEQIQALDDPAFLKRLHRQALQVESLEAFEALLPK